MRVTKLVMEVNGVMEVKGGREGGREGAIYNFSQGGMAVAEPLSHYDCHLILVKYTLKRIKKWGCARPDKCCFIPPR